ncbi:XPB/Ssl2-like helicase family protein [Kribbella amoyensis]|uniref:XPB/Ssl2-like helicase family protein n=1 Tax=Kribbella amoyensis TaxID=996641 RepID=A0A561BK93_9ACTN|nr:helicase C-terminal domain-containing protein [Kribbella amoyensis]TWD79281.1 XPB/Ssl2-like helicase family protein [Kribbella amoyensis]
MSTNERTRPRTLAEALRTWDDAALGRLLKLRPDLATPIPADTGQLAARATTNASAARAINRLDEFGVDLLEALSALPEPVDLGALAFGVNQPAEIVRPRVDELLALALVWGDEEDLRPIRAVHELLGPTPAGLGPVTTRHFGNLDRLIEEAGPDAREVLAKLTWGPPTGSVEKADRPVTIASARTPVERLLARGLVVPRDANTVVLPRQIGLHLRGGHVLASTRPTPPPLDGKTVSASIADRAAAGAALDLVRLVDRALEQLGTEPPPVLRTGGIGVRELRSLATKTGMEEQAAAAVLEIAYAAGLVAAVEVGTSELWLPTAAYDDWLELNTAHRWAQLVIAWFTGLRAIGLIGRRDTGGATAAARERLVNALAPDLERLLAPEVRRLTLQALAEAGPGTAPTAEAVTTWVAWHRPRRGGQFRDDLVEWTITEASLLGLTGLGSFASHAAVLLGEEPAAEELATAIAPLVPEPVSEFLLQADLTAVAPGPLVRTVQDELTAMADVESHGGGGVYRFSENSVRRAFDLGRTSDQLHKWLAEHSRTPVPQPLTYLIDDVARRHGVLRIGTASTYLRCDDEDVLTQLLSSNLPGIRFRRLAPTVVVSPSPPDMVLSRLREAGLAPLAETFDGVVAVSTAGTRRGEPPRRRTSRDFADSPVELTDEQAQAVIEKLRAGDRVAAERPDELVSEPTAPAETMTVLANAAESGIRTWIAYVDHNGNSSERIVEPVRVADGWLTAYDEDADQPRTYALHRISGARPVEDD